MSYLLENIYSFLINHYPIQNVFKLVSVVRKGESLQLVAESIRFSNPVPEPGEKVRIEAKILNAGDEPCSFVAVFYWAPEIVMSPQQAATYATPEYEIYREDVELKGRESVSISFEWEAKEGFKCVFFFAK